ncbi:DUF3718 domain-containing protein [Aliikangiella maris]|uniref:DUF3718 domain-containing protein n=2 Tax=Aliikangiella maris TaxID=3162458 RepID=A0ABV2BTC2_9GAMM
MSSNCKKLINATVAVFCSSLLASGASFAQEKAYIADNTSLYTKICVQAAQGSPARLKKAVSESGMTVRHIANNIQCNGVSIADFAAKAGQLDNFKYLERYQKEMAE